MDEGNGATDQVAANDLAALLGLQRGANRQDLKRAFRAEVKRLHPDLGPRSPKETERLERLTAAYDAYKEEQARDEAKPTDPWEEAWSEASVSPDARAAAPGVPQDPLVADAAGAPWFTRSPEGPRPQPGFWSNRARPGGDRSRR